MRMHQFVVWMTGLRMIGSVSSQETDCYFASANDLNVCIEANLLPLLQGGESTGNFCEAESNALGECPPLPNDPEDLTEGTEKSPVVFCIEHWSNFMICVATNLFGCGIPIQICVEAASGDILEYDETCLEYQRRQCARNICTDTIEGCAACQGFLDNYVQCAENNIFVRCDPPTLETCDLPPTSTGIHLSYWRVVTASLVLSAMF